MSSARAEAAFAASRSSEIRLSRASTVDSTFGNMPSPMAKKTKPKISSSQKIRSEEHTSELQSLMRISYAVFCLKQKNKEKKISPIIHKLLEKTNTITGS